MVDFILADIPEAITAGDAVAWKRTIANAPASDGWVLSYALAKDGKQIKFDGSADGDDHLVDLDSADTTSWPAGLYKFGAFVTKDGNRYQIEEGVVEIRIDLVAATDGADVLPKCFKIRDAIEAVFEERATESQMSIATGGRQISEMSHAELKAALADAKADCNKWIRRNRRQRGKSTGSTIKVSFSD